jgi:hypothetical protein
MKRTLGRLGAAGEVAAEAEAESGRRRERERERRRDGEK